MKKIDYILFFIILMVIGSFFVYFLYYTKPVNFDFYAGNSTSDKRNASTSQELMREVKNASTTGEEIKNKNTFEMIVEKSDQGMCAALDLVNEVTLCQKMVALKIGEIKLCENINDKNIQEECVNEINLSKAVEGNNILVCSQISNESIKLNCLEKLIEKGLTESECEKISLQYKFPESLNKIEFRHLCEGKVIYRKAIAEKNIKICENIKLGNIKAQCLSSLNQIPLLSDNDNDGLNYSSEIIYGTDPKNSDTDKDGFKDGDEINSMHNPNGTGSLNPM